MPPSKALPRPRSFFPSRVTAASADSPCADRGDRLPIAAADASSRVPRPDRRGARAPLSARSVERQPELLAQNFAASELPARAIEYWRVAGKQAHLRAAYAEAIAHAQAGLRLAQDLPFTDHERAERMLPLFADPWLCG